MNMRKNFRGTGFTSLRSVILPIREMDQAPSLFAKRLDHQVIATGFEPVTVCLEGRCSIQLSYATISRKWCVRDGAKI